MNVIEVLWSLPFARTVAWALAHFLWQGTLVGLLLALALALLGRKSASLRYAVSVGTLAILLALPVATTLWLARTEEDQTILSDLLVSRVPAPLPVLPWFLAGWVVGVAVLSVYHFGGWLQVRRLRSRGTRPMPERWERVVDGLRRRLRIARAVRVLETSALAVPAVVGWLRPVILVPASALTGLTAHQLEAILAHELAHVRRHDYLVNLLQTVVETLLFYHPVVWWVSHVIRQEREYCCDDLVVAVCGDRLVYARALTELEGLRAAPSRLVLASAGGPLLARIHRIVGLPTMSSRSFWLASVFALGVLPLGIALNISLLLSEYRALGFGDLPREELIELASDGVVPEYIREWKNSSYPHKPVHNRDDRRYVAYDYKELRHHGITADEFWAMKALDYDDPHLLKAQGITLDYIRELADLGHEDLTREQLVRFRNLGIDAKLTRELAALGYENLPPDGLIALKENKVDPAFIHKAQAEKERNLSVEELVKLRQEARLEKTLREELWMGGG